MTSNQIAYWNYAETARANQAREAETHRANRVHEEETERHNRAMEDYNLSSLRETQRHNLAYEQESYRHNVASEQLGQSQLDESKRHNLASEMLGYYQADLNAATQRYGAETSAAASRYSAERHAYASMYGADFGYEAAKLSDATRRMELNTDRSQHVWDYNERVRHNKAEEDIARQRNRITALYDSGNLQLGRISANNQTANTISHLLGNLAGTLGQLVRTESGYAPWPTP